MNMCAGIQEHRRFIEEMGASKLLKEGVTEESES